ncbi:MAG: DUF924 family protein [Wenzhouxiangella sp.]
MMKARRSFLDTSCMHSESAVIDAAAIGLYEAHGDENSLEFELEHKTIFDHFSRYLHRNAILGGEPIAERLAFPERSDSSF